MDKAKKKLAQIQAQVRDAEVEKLLADPKYGYGEIELPNGKRLPPMEELIRWRLWNRTGGGLMAELGSHQLDAAGILIGAALEAHGIKGIGGDKIVHAKPLTVTAVGGRSIFPLDRDCEDHVYCMFEFPAPEYESDHNKKIVVTYSSINGNEYGHYGEVVMGTGGTMILEAEQEALLFKGPTSTKLKVGVDKKGGPTLDTAESGGHAVAVGKAATDAGPISRGYTEELEHWAWCIKNPSAENQPRCRPEVAVVDAVIALTSNIAIRDPKRARIEFNTNWFEINSDVTPEDEKPNIARDEYKV